MGGEWTPELAPPELAPHEPHQTDVAVRRRRDVGARRAPGAPPAGGPAQQLREEQTSLLTLRRARLRGQVRRERQWRGIRRGAPASHSWTPWQEARSDARFGQKRRRRSRTLSRTEAQCASPPPSVGPPTVGVLAERASAASSVRASGPWTRAALPPTDSLSWVCPAPPTVRTDGELSGSPSETSGSESSVGAGRLGRRPWKECVVSGGLSSGVLGTPQGKVGPLDRPASPGSGRLRRRVKVAPSEIRGRLPGGEPESAGRRTRRRRVGAGGG